jgi:hypothetical protein
VQGNCALYIKLANVMKTIKVINTDNLDESQMKAVALLQHLESDYFVLDDKVFKGTISEVLHAYNEPGKTNYTEQDIINDSAFYDWCIQALDQVEEIDNNCYDADMNYMVCTNEEADYKWEESLDSYLEECVYPELPDNMANYFDDEKWKRDARFDGRGHSLSSYDGNEYEEVVNGKTYYIYRIN